MKPAKLEKLIYLSIAASPGGLKIFILTVIGILGGAELQGNIANDLAIITFLSMLTAIGAGAQILHVIPKNKDEAKEAAEKFKGILLILLPYILSICSVVYTSDLLGLSFLNEGSESAVLLFTSSIYWLLRHYYLARADLKRLLLMEIIVWVASVVSFALIKLESNLTPSNVLISISVSYVLSIAFPLITIIRVKADCKQKFIGGAISVGVSNLVSGGVINLAPSICFHTGSPVLAGAVGLMISISSIMLTVIRAFLFKKIPEISNSISDYKMDAFGAIREKTQKKINSITIACFVLLQPITLLAVLSVQPSLGLNEIVMYSLLTATFICVPQFSAVDSVVINYFGRTMSMLVINSLHAVLVFLATAIAYETNEGSPLVFLVFLLLSIILYLVRNVVLERIISNVSNKVIWQGPEKAIDEEKNY